MEDQPRDTYNEDNSISDPPPAGGTIDAESLKSRWNSFLSEHATAGNGLYILKQAPLQVDFLNGQIILKAENDFVAENLKRSKQKLFDSLERHFGAHVDVKILVGDIEEVNNFFGEPPKPPEINNSNKETSVNSSDEIVSRKADLEGRHPVEQEIIKLFGAEEIPNGRT